MQSSVAMSLSLQDYAVAVFQPFPPSGSVAAKVVPQTTTAGEGSTVHPSEAPTADTTAHKCPYSAKSASWAERLKNQKDLMLKPGASLSIIDDQKILTPSAEATPPTTGSFDANADMAKQTSLSIRVRDALAIIPGGNAIMELVQHELRDVNDALNQLLIVVGRTLDRMRADAKDTKRRALKAFWARNRRASRNARRLTRAGKRMLARMTKAKV
jgi:hypothetical protein